VTYTIATLVGLAVTVALDVVVLRTRLLRRRAFWTAYAITVCFQLIVNGVLTGRHIVMYDERRVTGLRIAYAPVEDLLFGFSLVAQTLIWWVWLGRRASRRARPARHSPGTATAARRAGPTRTRRSSTR
jgi:lycopene cyclase domain-containing protein